MLRPTLDGTIWNYYELINLDGSKSLLDILVKFLNIAVFYIVAPISTL
jgi:hypothetical protein